MHRALLCPDIVSEIVKELYPDWLKDEHTFSDLYNCAQVNKLFFQEAARVLWLGCGGNTPGVRHLARIAEYDPARAQIYANHLSYFDFGSFEESEDERVCGLITFDTVYLDVLSTLQYPELESITIYGTGEVISDHVLECYLQPKLESFTLEGEFSGSLDTFLETVTRQCPKIMNIDFHCQGPLTVRIGSFLEQHPLLSRFSFPPAHSEWLAKDFSSVCQMRGLTELYIPYLEASWLREVEAGWPELDGLRTTLSSDAIKRLTQLAPETGILELKLESVPPPSNAFTELSQFTHMRSLVITLSRTDGPREACINARDLVALAQNCPKLFRFHISGESNHPVIHGITDSLFQELTRNLPKISDFCLDVDDMSALSFKAVYSLGRHCQKLWQATLACNVDWLQEMEADLPTDLQFQFSELTLIMRGERYPLERWTDTDRKRTFDFAEKLMDVSLERPIIKVSGGNDADEYVNEVLEKCMYKRLLED